MLVASVRSSNIVLMAAIPCQLCGKRQATTHLTELEPDGTRRELHMCPSCIQAMGGQLDSGPPPIAALKEKATSGAEGEPDTGTIVAAEGEDESCPGCGLAFSEYASNNLFGCAGCYSAFVERLEALLKRYHGATRHVGRAPQNAPTTVTAALPAAKSATSQRRRLEAQLKDAVSKERYEEAATLRDQLRKLESAKKGAEREPTPEGEA
jgi:protein arginine kinase activator